MFLVVFVFLAKYRFRFPIITPSLPPTTLNWFSCLRADNYKRKRRKKTLSNPDRHLIWFIFHLFSRNTSTVSHLRSPCFSRGSDRSSRYQTPFCLFTISHYAKATTSRSLFSQQRFDYTRRKSWGAASSSSALRMHALTICFFCIDSSQ